MNINVIRQIIKEEIRKHEHEKLITEFFAYERSDFKDKIEQHIPIIFVHWCLIKYYQLINDFDNIYIKHWKKEISAQLLFLTRLKIKKNNSYNNRLKAIQQIWDDAEFTTDAYNLALCFEHKFNEEHIDVKSTTFQNVLKEWQKECEFIIQIIATNNLQQVNEYINKI